MISAPCRHISRKPLIRADGGDKIKTGKIKPGGRIMTGIALIFLLAVYFLVISRMLSRYTPEERTLNATRPLSVIISLSPLIGTVIFTILFTCVLKGRLAERSTHAFLLFAIWIYAARFYQYILSYYKKKEILAGSVVGMIFSIVLAILLTPLDRYVNMIYSRISWYSVFLGCGLYAVFYAATFRRKPAGSK